VLALSGCARHYVIRLNNGQQITTASKPKLKGAAYYFKDARGREHVLPEGRVHEIEPASMAKEELAPMPTRQTQPKKPRHWYLLWLG
jgi:hypothetical protein